MKRFIGPMPIFAADTLVAALGGLGATLGSLGLFLAVWGFIDLDDKEPQKQSAAKTHIQIGLSFLTVGAAFIFGALQNL